MNTTLVRLGCGTVPGLLAASAAGTLYADTPAAGGAHGAMDVAAQQKRLDQLHISDTGVPAGVDPVAWSNIYVPADNPLTPGSYRPRTQVVFRYAPVAGWNGFTLTDSRFAAENDVAFKDQKAQAGKQRPFRDDALAHRQVLPFETRVIGPAGLK